jgi:hypothetical protein
MRRIKKRKENKNNSPPAPLSKESGDIQISFPSLSREGIPSRARRGELHPISGEGLSMCILFIVANSAG